MKRCSVRNCNYTSETAGKAIRFFAIPMNNKLAKQWLAFCNNPMLKYCKGTYVCSQHFKPEDIGMCRLKPNAVPCLKSAMHCSDSEKTKRQPWKTNKPNYKCVKDDPLDSSDIEIDTADSENSEDTEDENSILKTEIKPKQFDDLLDTESSEAVIDELSNQIKDLRMENLRLNVNLQLVQKKYKADVKKLTEQLEEANAQILLLEMQQEYRK